MNESGIHFLHQQKPSWTKKPVPSEAKKICSLVAAGLSDLLRGTFDAVDDSLFELANNARSNNEQNRYFEAMRESRIKRKGVEKRFQEGLIDLFENPDQLAVVSKDAESRPSAETLTLVKNDDLEVQVAVNAMITRAKANFQGTLLQLQVRFGAIYAPEMTSKQPINPPINPLAPELICRVFLDAANGLDIQIREKLILLKQFDRYVMANLGMVLDEANRILIQAGVLPDFKFRGSSNQSAQQAATAPQPDNATIATAANHASSDLFEQIRLLLASQRPPMATPRAQNASLEVISGAELLELLSVMSAGHPALDRPATDHLERPLLLDFKQLINSVVAQHKTADGKQPVLNEVDEDLINLVSMLFEFILEDYNLSPPIQVLISRLQIPILKVVIKDRSFFSKATHPARKLLNALARAGIGWSDSGEKDKDKLYEQIHHIVMRILDEFNGDIALFEQLHESFDQFISRENRKATLVEQRTREAERGRIKSQKAQDMVDQILQDKLTRHNLPESVKQILVNGWTRVMFLAYLRDDTEHRWNQTVKVVDDLIWCLNPNTDQSAHEQWVKLVPKLLKTLRSGLEEVSYNSARLEDMMGELRKELTEAFRARSSSPGKASEILVSGVESVAKPVKTAVERQQEIEDAAVSEHIAQIDAINVGAWVEFNLVNGARFRCKLSAVISEADCFVFVNRMGLKVTEKSRLELAHEMRRGRLTLLDQGALIDRALDAVVGSLRREAS